MKFRICVVAALGMFSQCAMADEGWQKLATIQGKYTLSLDAQSFKREGDVINVRLRYGYDEKKTLPFLARQYDKMDRLYYFQCRERMFVLAESSFLEKDVVVHSVKATANPFAGAKATEPQPVTPDSMESEALAAACEYRKK